MSFYSNVTEQDWNNLRKLAEQQKNQFTPKNKKRILKQFHDIKLAENLSPISKKSEEVNESTKIIEVIKESSFKNENNQEIVPVEIDSEGDNTKPNIRALPNSNNFGNSMIEMLGSIMNSRNSLKITQDELGRAIVLNVPFQLLGADRIQINDNVYD